jgi:hypothetical protein
MIELAVKREVPDGVYPLLRVFEGFDRSPAIEKIFPGGEPALDGVMLKIGPSPKYMRVMQDDGCIHIGRHYLRTGDLLHLYLDLIHEVVHVRQQREGRALYDMRFRYIDRPTELEAMTITVEEARRCGMEEGEIIDYLKVPWITADEHRELVLRLGLPSPEGREAR